MKKIIVTMSLALAATNINAQLVVDSLGHVGVGLTTPRPSSLLSVGSYGNDYYDAAMQCTVYGKTYGLYIMNHANKEYEMYGIFSNARNSSGKCYGGRCEARGVNNANISQEAIGMHGIAGEAPTAAGIMGAKLKAQDIIENFAGVYGSEYSSRTLSFGNYSGSYAGYFRGKIRATEGIYGTLLSPSASPSPSGNGATILSDRGESVTDKLSQVQAYQFLRYEPGRKETIVDENEEEVEIEPNLSPVQYGLDADQLKSVYPELVYEDNNGNVSINYVEMVPLLVQSINELSTKVEYLEQQLGMQSSRKAKAQPTAIEETVSDVDMVRMDQNKPNPFSESTVITLNIPSNAQAANIYIYDMNGKQAQSLPVSERGETNITVYAADLSAGMYIYTLVVDGKVAVTRRMIVSKN